MRAELLVHLPADVTAGTDRYDAAICALMALQYAAKGVSPCYRHWWRRPQRWLWTRVGSTTSPLMNRIGLTSPIRPLAVW